MGTIHHPNLSDTLLVSGINILLLIHGTNMYLVLGTSAMQRKKSLPDVAALPVVTVKQGSQAMTREEISVLSSARREEIRRQLDEAERYRANPILYIFNPHIRE